MKMYYSIHDQDDWKIASYVLTIYNDVLTCVKYHDPDFIAMVERALLQLLAHCPLQVSKVENEGD